MKTILSIILSLLIAFQLMGQQRMDDVTYFRGHFYLPSLINGHPANLIFDTGAPYVCLDSIFFSKSDLQYEHVFAGQMGGAGNSMARVRIIVDELTYTVAGKEYLSHISPIFQLKPIVGDDADGLLGLTELKGKIIALDYHGQRVGFWDHLEAADTVGYTRIPVVVDGTRIKVPVTVVVRDDKRIEVQAIMDLGSGGSMSLTSLVANKYGLGEIGPKREYYIVNGGVGGEATGYVFRGNSVSIGPYTLKGVIMDYSTNTNGAMVKEDVLGLLGNDILSRFDVIVDQEGQQLYLRPNADFEKPYDDSGAGFNYTDRSKTLGCWVVNALFRDSNAEKAGLRGGDHIIAIDGQSVKEFTHKQLVGYFDNKSSVSLTILRDGQQLEIAFDFDPEIL